MFNKSNAQATKVQSEEQRVADLTNNLNTLLRATSSNYNNSDNFYAEYTAFLSELSGTFQSLRQYAANSTGAHAQAQEQARTRNAEFQKNTEEVNAALDSKRRELEDAQNNVRKHTGALNPKLFAKLKVKETPALTTLFNNLYQTYYPEQQTAFDWVSFKKTEVEKNKLADFNNRLVSADYNTIPQERIEALDYLKTDAELAAVGAKKDGAQVLELINFLTLVRGVADLQRDIAQLQTRLEGLRTEQQAHEQAGVATNQLAHKRNEHLAALSDRMTASAAPFGNVEQRTVEQRQAYEDHKRHIRNLIEQTESQISGIPESVYTA
jgi:chromosome segregation ATPase